jgi:uncharacterized protein Usg
MTTAEITYHFPDYPGVLQNFVWQDFDIQPDFPVLTKFLKFWQQNLDGALHSVILVSSQLISPKEFRIASSFHTLQ